MAVFIDGTNVIVRVESLDKLFPGGVEGLEQSSPNRTFCSDGRIARLGFMAYSDASHFISKLEDCGLTHKMSGRCIDIALCTSVDGAEEECDWVCVDHDPRGFDYAWLAGDFPGPIAAPEHIDLDNFEEELTFHTQEEIEEHLEFLKEEGGLRVYRDKRDGTILYSGRTTSLTNEAVEARVNALWQRTFQLESDAGVARQNNDQERGVAIYSELIEIANESESLAEDDISQSIYLAGLVRRVLERWEDAYVWFRRFADRHPFNQSIWLELTWCLAMMGKMDESLAAAKKAHELAPDSPAALGNLAAALNGVGKRKEAKAYLTQALKIDPNDIKNNHLLSYLNSLD